METLARGLLVHRSLVQAAALVGSGWLPPKSPAARLCLPTPHRRLAPNAWGSAIHRLALRCCFGFWLNRGSLRSPATPASRCDGPPLRDCLDRRRTLSSPPPPRRAPLGCHRRQPPAPGRGPAPALATSNSGGPTPLQPTPACSAGASAQQAAYLGRALLCIHRGQHRRRVCRHACGGGARRLGRRSRGSPT